MTDDTEAPLAPPTPTTAAAPRWTWALLAGLLLLITLPLMVALGVLHSPRWYPLLDLAQTELRVRDVGFSHPPLIGLPGRLGVFPNQGSHPGPLSFYALAPFYRLFGSTPFALQAATAAVHAVAIGVALWVARRRGGAPLMLATGAVAALLTASYGAAILTEGWNPYLPVMWWLVFLLATWSVAAGDFPMLPVAVLAGSFCMQTHLPYLGLAGAALGVVVVGVVAYTYWSPTERARAGSLWRWIAIAVGVGVVLWLPPVIEQFTTDPGNLRVIVDDLTNPREAVTGPSRGLSLFFSHLNPWQLFANRGHTPDVREATGALLPGILYFAAWVAAAVVALRTRVRSLIAFHAVVAVGLAFAATSMVAHRGPHVVLPDAVGVGAQRPHGSRHPRHRVRRRRGAPRRGARDRFVGWVSVGCGVIVVASTAFFAVDAAYTDVPNPPVTNSVGEVARPTLAAFARGELPGTGSDGRYYVTWNDLYSLGGRGYSLLDELEREGFTVGTSATSRVGCGRTG